jgi:formylmethanofuran dehydrogenase subunit A
MAGLEKILIRQARAYDPSQGWQGEPRDLYLAGGKISEPFGDPARTIQAAGRPLLAGGIDPYCQLAGHGQNVARMFANTPSPEEIGLAYARMGYVHVHHPFTTLLTAGLVRYALQRIPFVDTSTCVTLDLRDMGQTIRAKQTGEFSRLARALMAAAGAIGLSLPFPDLRHRQRHYIQKNLSAQKVLSFLCLVEESDLLPIHLWGMPGLLDNEFPEAHRFHIAGLGFTLDSEASLEKAREFLEAGGSGDLGLCTGQEQFVVAPHSATEKAFFTLDAGMQAPLGFSSRPLPLGHARTMAGWSLLQTVPSSWRLALAASGPAGGQFGGMPSILQWLTDPESRPREVSEALRGHAFSLSEWARLTRVEAARVLGLSDVGHLRVGARANIALYDLKPEAGGEKVLCALCDCWCLIKDGVLVREGGAFTGRVPPRETRRREIAGDVSGVARSDLFQNPTLRFENLGACPGALGRVECPNDAGR